MLAIVQARMSSSRLPGKVLRPLLGEPMLGRQLERIRRAARVTRIIVATSTRANDDVLARYAETVAQVFRGDLDDVLGRFAGVLDTEPEAEHCVRITADCPLTDPAVIDRCIERHLGSGADATVTGRSFPKGLDVEVVRTSALRAAHREARDPYDREHVMPFVRTRPERFRIETVERDPALPRRWTVDTPADFAFVQAAYEALYPADPAFSSEAVERWQDAHPSSAIRNHAE